MVGEKHKSERRHEWFGSNTAFCLQEISSQLVITTEVIPQTLGNDGRNQI